MTTGRRGTGLAGPVLAQSEVRPAPVTDPGLREIIPSVSMTAAAVVAAFLGAVLAWRPPPAPSDKTTINGAYNVVPEHDVQIYLGVVAAFVVVMVVIAAIGRGTRRQQGPRAHVARRRAGLALAGSAGATLIGIACFTRAARRLPAGPRIRPWELAVFAVVVAGCLLGAWALSPRRPAGPRPAPAVHEAPARLRLHVADLLVPVVIVAFLYLPGWRRLAGNAFVGEQFLHIDYFAMAGAKAFKAGVALGTGMHVYYGVGWSLALAKMPVIGTLSYGHFIRLEVVYGCIYFMAVYALLRVLLGNWRWAATGVSLAILAQLFGSWDTSLILWRYPSATVLRWAFDVWFFLACLQYLRTRRPVWLVLGGVLVGLALLCVTDSGSYLALSAVFFWTCLWRLDPRPPALVRAGIQAGVAGLGVLLLGLQIASRWTAFSPAFREGWLENLRFTKAGATLQPLTGVVDRRLLLWFALMLSTYLVVVGYTAVRFLHGRLSDRVVLLGTVAFYGLFTILYFVGRSNVLNLFRPAVPFVIVAVGGAATLHDRLRGRTAAMAHGDRRGFAAVGRAPQVALVAALIAVALHPGVRAYPGLAKVAVSGEKNEGICLFHDPDDVCGIPGFGSDAVDELHAVADHLRALGSPTRSVAILDSIGPLLYGMADTRPWGRYVPTFPGLHFRTQVQTVVADLNDYPPELIVMRSPELRQSFYEDLWQAVRPSVERGFTLESRFRTFEIWQRRPIPPVGGKAGRNP